MQLDRVGQRQQNVSILPLTFEVNIALLYLKYMYNAYRTYVLNIKLLE